MHRIEFCTAFNPCAAGATCNNKITDYTCTCPPGMSGKNCTTNVDNCDGHLCQVSADRVPAWRLCLVIYTGDAGTLTMSTLRSWQRLRDVVLEEE